MVFYHQVSTTSTFIPRKLRYKNKPNVNVIKISFDRGFWGKIVLSDKSFSQLHRCGSRILSRGAQFLKPKVVDIAKQSKVSYMQLVSRSCLKYYMTSYFNQFVITPFGNLLILMLMKQLCLRLFDLMKQSKARKLLWHKW